MKNPLNNKDFKFRWIREVKLLAEKWGPTIKAPPIPSEEELAKLQKPIKLTPSVREVTNIDAFLDATLPGWEVTNPEDTLYLSAKLGNEEVEEAERRGLSPGTLVQLTRKSEEELDSKIFAGLGTCGCVIQPKEKEYKNGDVLLYLGSVDATLGKDPGYPIKVQRWLWGEKVILANINQQIYSIIRRGSPTNKEKK